MATIYADGYVKVEAKTAAYQLTVNDNGKVFTNRGAGGSVTFTLPPTTGLNVGFNARFFACVTNQNLVIASSGSSDDIVAYNDIGADSITFSTSAKIAGASVMVIWDGTGWLCVPGTWNTGADGTTVTVATIA